MNRFSLHSSQRAQRGDTIVEVLISIAIVSLILGGAYVTTNNSLRSTRAAEERSTALKLVQGQLELIKSMMASSAGATALTSAPPMFCVVPNTIAGAQPSTPSSSSANCKVSSGGVPTTVEPIYNLQVVQSGNLFTVTNKWDSVVNNGQDNVQMTYRVYQQ
ncbi:MAG TPA: prepilin-type N-terminal cleavage/methylation domain-containing protein [Candidatus Saccharimonadales bacterium]|nr:prepilin-type N-terminal cleavage/methylation domain-containing protein [Candidatus Saccharimonadales bacterium]